MSTSAKLTMSATATSEKRNEIVGMMYFMGRFFCRTFKVSHARQRVGSSAWLGDRDKSDKRAKISSPIRPFDFI